MKPPVNIDLLMAEWEKDSKMDETEPGLELMRIPILHGKYLNIMTYHNTLSHKSLYKYKHRRQIKSAWYAGELNNPDDLAKHELEPCLVRYTKHRIEEMLESDEELTTLQLKQQLHSDIVEYCRAVIKELGNRTFQLRAYIDYLKFTNGNN